MKFLAGVHGIDLSSSLGKGNKTKSEKPDQKIPLFGDPEEYKNLSKEERDKVTEKMMNKHKSWANNDFLKGTTKK